MIEVLNQNEAQVLFSRLPIHVQLFTLSPAYVLIDAKRDTALQPFFLAYEEGDSFWLYGVHRGRVPGTLLYDLQSPYGYGGPLANSSDPEFLNRAWQAYCCWCKSHDILAEFVRFHPLAENSSYYSGTIQFDRMTVAVPLQQNELMSTYKTRVRTAVRKAKNEGVKAVWESASAICDAFPSFYRKSMREIGADSFYLFGDDYFATLAQNPDVHLLVCLSNGVWVAAGIFLGGGSVLEYHLSATTEHGRAIGATNLLLHCAAVYGREQGLDWLFLGGGTDCSNENSLLFFKSGFAEMRFAFQIGYAIHQTEMYQQLKKQNAAGDLSARVLFYR